MLDALAKDLIHTEEKFPYSLTIFFSEDMLPSLLGIQILFI